MGVRFKTAKAGLIVLSSKKRDKLRESLGCVDAKLRVVELYNLLDGAKGDIRKEVIRY